MSLESIASVATVHFECPLSDITSFDHCFVGKLLSVVDCGWLFFLTFVLIILWECFEFDVAVHTSSGSGQCDLYMLGDVSFRISSLVVLLLQLYSVAGEEF